MKQFKEEDSKKDELGFDIRKQESRREIKSEENLVDFGKVDGEDKQEVNSSEAEKKNRIVDAPIEKAVDEEKSDIEASYKELEEEKQDDFLTPSMKGFRRAVAILAIATIVLVTFVGNFNGNSNYKSNLASEKLSGVKAGDALSKEFVKLEAKDFTVDSTSGYGKIELSVWNFSDKEDGDYVQVFVDGSPQTEPFAIRHKPVKVSVPDKAVIQVKGIRDGSGNGITYGVTFSKTGETYLNTVPINAANTYTIKTSK
ncbi:hypothetical protein [Clostridium manihotivorum]|uniref:Uncharacterized protein n=1 Tax=Clostridium manihotivorum TaxID=2320868 RepID=A0A3R5X244_9CLOT|nr:hypothetical protein [Clostridium manihotivorum]QAA32583.1 hypothetical protein C1I91_13580 [Clostridium manihotivorum]